VATNQIPAGSQGAHKLFSFKSYVSCAWLFQDHLRALRAKHACANSRKKTAIASQ
jgi:hypothetical protein